jgi:hypothetical protein
VNCPRVDDDHVGVDTHITSLPKLRLHARDVPQGRWRFERISMAMLNHAKADPDLDIVRNDPRFQAMVAAAETRLSAAD